MLDRVTLYVLVEDDVDRRMLAVCDTQEEAEKIREEIRETFGGTPMSEPLHHAVGHLCDECGLPRRPLPAGLRHARVPAAASARDSAVAVLADDEHRRPQRRLRLPRRTLSAPHRRRWPRPRGTTASSSSGPRTRRWIGRWWSKSASRCGAATGRNAWSGRASAGRTPTWSVPFASCSRRRKRRPCRLTEVTLWKSHVSCPR